MWEKDLKLTCGDDWASLSLVDSDNKILSSGKSQLKIKQTYTFVIETPYTNAEKKGEITQI